MAVNKDHKFFGACILITFLLVGLSGCDKDDERGVKTEDTTNDGSSDDNNDKEEESVYSGASSVFIANEGTFNQGNASLALYKPEDGTITEEHFRTKNGRPLGDVFHSMLFQQERAFLVINNSSKIEVVDIGSMSSLGSIRSLPSPRYMQPLGNNKGYVSNFTQGSSSELSIVDMNAYQKTGTITTSGWTEQMVKAKNKVWVAEVNLAGLLVVNPEENKVTDTIMLQKQVQEVLKDNQGMIWTLSNGGLNDSQKPILYKIDPGSKTIAEQFNFPAKSDQPGSLTFSRNKDTLYFLNEGIYQMSIESASLPNKPIIEEPGNRNFYGLGVDPYNGRFYVSDALDYVQKGLVFTYSAQDKMVTDTLKPGIIPRSFRFLK